MVKNWWMIVLIVFAYLLIDNPAWAQIQDWPDEDREGILVNYTEANVGGYALPELLKMKNGETVKDADTWFEKRRPEIIELFEAHQFGHTPDPPRGMSFDVFDQGTSAFDGKALRKQVTIYFSENKAGPAMELLIYLPADASKPAPLLLNISFAANASIVDDPGVKKGTVWNREKEKVPAPDRARFGSLSVLPFLDAGFGIATVYYGDIDPDFAGGIPYGVRNLYLKPDQTEPASDEWGTISAWAWGLSRAMDYFETDTGIDAKRVAITGVSRLGKTALWTAARDPRYALVIASCSGEGGAALSRRNYGETIKLITLPERFGYQFAGNYARYGDDPNQSPVDAHMLISLIAPRPILLQTGNTDKWSDPMGEFLAAVAAEPVYQLFGKKGLEIDRVPAAGVPVFNDIGYYMHDGGHGSQPDDWEQYLKFIKLHLQPDAGVEE